MKSLTAAFVFGMAMFHSILTVAQYAENITYKLGTDSTGHSIYIIQYDLKAPYPTIPSIVKVKLTAEDRQEKTFYLKDVTGDVGNLVYPGLGKKIYWNHIKELVHFSGKISLAVEVSPTIQVPEKIKSGKSVPILLAPVYEAKKTYAVKLFRAGKELERLNDVLLIENKVSIPLPKKIKKKKRYQIAITDGDKVFYSNTFKVKPKVGYGWKALPILAIPVYLVINMYLEENKPLPGPPNPN
jgi:hypothetical protein